MLAILLIEVLVSWGENEWIINSRSSPAFILVVDILRPINYHIVHIGEKQHTYFVTFPEAGIERCSRRYLWEEQHFYKSYRLQEFFKGFPSLEVGLFFMANSADIF